MNINIAKEYYNIQLEPETNENLYKRKAAQKQKNTSSIITYQFDITLIQYEKIKKDIHRLFPFCYKNTIKTILYKLYLVSLKLGSDIFFDLLKLKLVLYTTSIILDINIRSLKFDYIYSFVKSRGHVKIDGERNHKWDLVSNCVEIKIICNYLLELCFIRSFDIIYKYYSKQNKHGNITIEANFFDTKYIDIKKYILDKLEILSYNNDESKYILYDKDKIDIMIHEYILDIKSDYLLHSALYKYIITTQHNNNTNSKSIIDLSYIDGMCVVSHSECIVEHAIIVPEDTIFIFLQNIGNKCIAKSDTMGNTNLFIIYEILHIISTLINKVSNHNNQQLNIKKLLKSIDIEKILSRNSIIEKIYDIEDRHNRLKVYYPGQVLFDQSSSFDITEYTYQNKLELNLQKPHRAFFKGIISLPKLLKINNISPIDYHEPSNNTFLDRYIDNENNNNEPTYNTKHNRNPLIITRKSLLNQIIDKDNVYYKELLWHEKHTKKSTNLHTLLQHIEDSQRVFRKLQKNKKQIEQIQEPELKSKINKKLKYIEQLIFKNGYLDINNNKLKICIFVMCRNIPKIDGFFIYTNYNRREKLYIKTNEQLLEKLLYEIDYNLNYTFLVETFIHQKYIIPTKDILDTFFDKIQSTNFFPNLVTCDQNTRKRLLKQHSQYHKLNLKDKIAFINQFLLITFKSPNELLFNIEDKYEYLENSHTRNKVTYYIFLSIQIDLQIFQKSDLDALHIYYNSKYLLQYQDPDEYYYRKLLIPDYIFLYYLNSFAPINI